VEGTVVAIMADLLTRESGGSGGTHE
jgi:hypothetical protein